MSTRPEIAAFFVLLSVAGNDTTRHTTSLAMRALSVNPDQRVLLAEDPEARLPAAAEEFVRWASPDELLRGGGEFVRWASPVLTFRRTTTREVVIHGQRLAPGGMQRCGAVVAPLTEEDGITKAKGVLPHRRDPKERLGGGRRRASASPVLAPPRLLLLLLQSRRWT